MQIMRILMISPMYPSQKDPVFGTFVQTYMEGFKELNIQGETQLICIRGRSKSRFVKIAKYIWLYIQTFFCLLFKDYDVVYVQTITTTIPPIKLVSYLKHLPLVFNVHGADVITISKWTEKLKQIATPLLYKSKMIVAPSEYFKGVVLKTFPKLEKDKVFVSASGGVDLGEFKPYHSKSERNYVTIGYVSRIDYGKGWDIFVGMIAFLRERGFNVKGVMIGRGAEQGKLIDLINTKSLNEYIQYVGGVSHNKLPSYFNQFDIFVFPSKRNESLGLVGVEALACGVPVLGSDIGGIPGFVIDGENGLLFKPGDTQDLIDKALYYFELDDEKRNRMKEKARESAKRYENKVVMSHLFCKLEELCC